MMLIKVLCFLFPNAGSYVEQKVTNVTILYDVALAFDADLAGFAEDYWKNALIKVYDNALAGQVQKVTGYNASTDFITVGAAFTGTPAAGDAFELINK